MPGSTSAPVVFLPPSAVKGHTDTNRRTYEQLDASLEYLEPRKNSNGGMSVSFMCEGSKIYIQTPEMRCPFGINNYKRNDGRDNLSTQVQFNSLNDDCVELENLISALDQKHIKAAKTNAGTWFTAKIKPELIDGLYKDSAIPSKQPDKYAPTWRLKVNAGTQFFGEDRNILDVNAVQNGCYLTCLVECSPLWFVNNGISPTYTLIQAKVRAKQDAFSSYALVDTDGDSQMD